MRRLFSICLLALSLGLVSGAAPALAVDASASATIPKITRVQPMRVSVGGTLVISGRNFKPRRAKNTVIFRSPSGRTAFAKPRRASRRKLALIVPAAVARLLNLDGARQTPTRLRLRVLAGKFSKYTTRRLSPVVTGTGEGDGVDGPGGGGGGGLMVCDSDADHDNDLLGNSLEIQIGTDPCLEDTDGDQMTDGWEYWSARDLNVKAVPYPGSRPFPNALDPSDGGGPGARYSTIDFDGDGLTTLEEYRAWRLTGSRFNGDQLDRPGLETPPDLESVLGYSDGTKYSRAREVPAVPVWRSNAIYDYGLPNPAQLFPATYDLWGDSEWRDDERDADQDGLSNFLESAQGPSNTDWWEKWLAKKPREIKPFADADGGYCGGTQRPGFFDERPFQNLDLANGDVDSDTLLDGEDDQDDDGYINIVELYEVEKDLDGNGQPAWCGTDPLVMPTIDIGGVPFAINPFNPCAPDMGSRTCPRIPL